MDRSARPPDSAAPDLRIRLLGGFAVAVGGRPVPRDAWGRPKAASLVKLLALAPSGSLHREQVLDALWPELEPAAGANNLNQTLHLARRALGAVAARSSPSPPTPFLRLRDGVISLVPAAGEAAAARPEVDRAAVWVDVGAFEAAAGRARRSGDTADYREALDLYGGDLLPDDAYAEWTVRRREALRRQRAALLLGLARLLEGAGDPVGAEEALAQLVADDPADEAAGAALVRLLAGAGRHHEALREFERLRAALAEVAGAAPAPETDRLYRDVLAGRVPPAPAAPPPLPAPLSSFVGREQEVATLRRLLVDAVTGRLVTITGPGGVGKTRVALRVAALLREDFPDGVWFVELGAIGDPALVPQTVATGLGVHEQPGRPLTDTLAAFIRRRRALLVVDNCEHLAQACAALAESLLRACPALRVLATSRDRLRVGGEVDWPLPSLAVPGRGRFVPAERLLAFDAPRLFCERAAAAAPGFRASGANAAAVVEICRRLDGIPLALELAAARMRVLTAEQIVVRLDEPLGLLTGGSRSAPPRQQTLRATVEWSYGLLEEPERRLFDRLSVFAGGFDLAAAEAVGAVGDADRAGVLDRLSGLVDRSLVRAELPGADAAPPVGAPAATARFDVLETLRAYGRERLAASGEAAAVARRHADHYLALAERAEGELTGAHQPDWFRRLEADHANLREALRWSIAAGEVATALRLAGALGRFWWLHGHLNEGRAWLDRALALRSGAPAGAGRRSAIAVGKQGAPGDRAAAAGAALARAKALFSAGLLAGVQSDFAAAGVYLARCLRLRRRAGDRWGQARVLEHMAMSQLWQGGDHVERAGPLLDECEAIWSAIGDEWGVAMARRTRGLLYGLRGETAVGRREMRDAVHAFRAAGDSFNLAATLVQDAWIAAAAGETDGLEDQLRECARRFIDLGERWLLPWVLEAAAGLAVLQRCPALALRRAGAAAILREVAGALRPPVYRPQLEMWLAAARSELGPEAAEAAWMRGRADGPERMVADLLGAEAPEAIERRPLPPV